MPNFTNERVIESTKHHVETLTQYMPTTVKSSWNEMFTTFTNGTCDVEVIRVKSVGEK